MINKPAILLITGVFSILAICASALQPDSNTVDEQLQINKEAFLRGSNEQIRIAAAGLLLESNNPQARDTLISVLSDVNQPAARLALCKAIAGDTKDKIPNKEQLIEPLLNFLSSAKDAELRTVAEALLVFRYEQIETPLQKIVLDFANPIEIRLNGVFALRLQRDMRALVWLIKLLGDTEPQIVNAASEALNSLGIPAVGTDEATRRQMIDEIQRIGKDEFLRYWEVRQGYEKQIAALKEQREWWKQKYMASIDELYTMYGSDESARTKFLASRLSSAEAEIRLWALAKVTQWWVGTEPKTRLLAELGPSLIKLIGDQNREVRLNTAKLLALMSELDSSSVLLEQIKVEPDDAVRTEQFIAMGQVCRFAFSPKSPIKLDESIRKETLDLAVQYLESADPFKSQKGAEVIRNLLEFGGLADDQAEIYLIALAKRYENENQSQALSGSLLNSMAALCGQSSYNARAVRLYERFFVEALSNESDPVREAAVNGLINIDKSAALRRLRNDHVNDKNINIRRQLIALAEEVGTIDDLTWLAEKINANSEGPLAWRAMMSIFEHSSAATINEWIPKLEERSLADARMISFLELAERKASADARTEMLRNIRYKLASRYTKSGELARAAEYLGNLLRDDTDQNRRRQLRAELMSVYINAGNLKAAGLLVANRLLEADISAESPLAKVIDDYIKNPNGAIEPSALLEELSKIDARTAGDRPKWKMQLAGWAKYLASIPKPTPEPQETNQPDFTKTS